MREWPQGRLCPSPIVLRHRSLFVKCLTIIWTWFWWRIQPICYITLSVLFFPLCKLHFTSPTLPPFLSCSCCEWNDHKMTGPLHKARAEWPSAAQFDDAHTRGSIDVTSCCLLPGGRERSGRLGWHSVLLPRHWGLKKISEMNPSRDLGTLVGLLNEFLSSFIHPLSHI